MGGRFINIKENQNSVNEVSREGKVTLIVEHDGFKGSAAVRL